MKAPYTKAQARRAAKAARDAIGKMNNGGRHWIKGGWRVVIPTTIGTKKVEHAYCYLGGVEAALGLPPGQDQRRLQNFAYLLVIETSAETFRGYKKLLAKHGELRPAFEAARADAFVAYGEPTKKLRDRTRAMEALPMMFNDAQRRRWPDVKARLTKVAEILEGRAA